LQAVGCGAAGLESRLRGSSYRYAKRGRSNQVKGGDANEKIIGLAGHNLRTKIKIGGKRLTKDIHTGEKNCNRLILLRRKTKDLESC